MKYEEKNSEAEGDPQYADLQDQLPPSGSFYRREGRFGARRGEKTINGSCGLKGDEGIVLKVKYNFVINNNPKGKFLYA